MDPDELRYLAGLVMTEWNRYLRPNGNTAEDYEMARLAVTCLLEQERRRVRYWRVVDTESGGVVIDFSDRFERRADAKARADAWMADVDPNGVKYHLELWEQAWWTTPVEWTQLDLESSEGHRIDGDPRNNDLSNMEIRPTP